MTNLNTNKGTKVLDPFKKFLQLESASGIILTLMAAIALAVANGPWSQTFLQFWETDFGWGHSLHFLINEGLMTLFFFVAGMEIKRELATGEFRDRKKALLPILAALGGMIAPGIIYYALRQGQEGQEGWGIPVATDIAFVVGALSLLGSRVPPGLKIFLLSLAIADDIGAIIVVALFYSKNIAFSWLAAGGAGFLLISLFAQYGIRWGPIYLLLALAIWVCFTYSGIHPAVAGVMLGLLVSCQEPLPPNKSEIPSGKNDSLLVELETLLHPWVAYLIMPLFALANAGVPLEIQSINHPVALAVTLGLLLGKPIGIFSFTWIGVRLGIVRLPSGVNWKILFGGGILGGIGFTMSLFIAELALKEELLKAGKLGTFSGSILSALLGLVWLWAMIPNKSSNRDNLSTP